MTDSTKVTLKVIELTERILGDAELRGVAVQSGSSSCSGGIGGASSSTSGSALANLTASLAQIKVQDVSAAAGGQG
jgi:hypothetical protein